MAQSAKRNSTSEYIGKLVKIFCFLIVGVLFFETMVKPELFLTSANKQPMIAGMLVFNAVIVGFLALQLKRLYNLNKATKAGLFFGSAIIFICAYFGVFRLVAAAIETPQWIVNTNNTCTVSYYRHAKPPSSYLLFVNQTYYETNSTVFNRISFDYSGDMGRLDTFRCTKGTQFLYVKAINAVIDVK